MWICKFPLTSCTFIVIYTYVQLQESVTVYVIKYLSIYLSLYFEWWMTTVFYLILSSKALIKKHFAFIPWTFTEAYIIYRVNCITKFVLRYGFEQFCLHQAWSTSSLEAHVFSAHRYTLLTQECVQRCTRGVLIAHWNKKMKVENFTNISHIQCSHMPYADDDDDDDNVCSDRVRSTRI